MRSLGKLILFLVLIIASNSLAITGNPIVHYPLISNANDATGNYDPIVLVNAPFQDGGIYLDGDYSSSSARTPQLTGLDFDQFTISVEFKLSSYGYNFYNRRPIIVGSISNRWLGIEVTYEGVIGLLYNNSNFAPSGLIVELDRWYVARISYNSSTENCDMYLDGFHLLRQNFTLNSAQASRDITSLNGATANNFHGIMRNLAVWNEVLPFENIGVAGNTGLGGAGGGGGGNGGGGIPCQVQNGFPGTSGFQGQSGQTGGDGGNAGLTFMTSGTLNSSGMFFIGGLDGEAGSSGGSGASGGQGGNGGGVFGNGSAGAEPNPDNYPSVNGGAAGLWPSGTGGNGNLGGGGGGGGGSSPFVGGGYGAGGGVGDPGATGNGGNGSAGQNVEFDIGFTTNVSNFQIGGNGGRGGNGGNGGHGGGGGGAAGECWGNPAGTGGIGGAGGSGGPGGAGGSGGEGTLRLIGGHLVNNGHIQIGRGILGGTGRMILAQGGAITINPDKTLIIQNNSELISYDATTLIENLGGISALSSPLENFGTYTGDGFLLGTLHNYGIFSPGQAIGPHILDIYHEYGNCKMQLAGTNVSVPEYDFILVENSLYLDDTSTLTLEFYSGFSEDDLTYGDSFDLIRYPGGTRSGEFGFVDDTLAALTSGVWSLTYDYELGSDYSIRLVYEEELSAVEPTNLPAEFALGKIYPNPFNPRTTIVYDLPKSSTVMFRIYDLSGRQVWTSGSGSLQPAGQHKLVWNGTGTHGRNMASGTYLLRMAAGNFTATKRLVLVR